MQYYSLLLCLALSLSVATASIDAANGGDEPDALQQYLNQEGLDFDPATLARAMNYCVELGEEETVLRIEKAFGDQTRKFKAMQLCRLLYVDDSNGLRAPRIGASLNFPSRMHNSEDWPRYPFVKSGKSIFFLWGRGGYGGTGIAEGPFSYLKYCRANGSFLSEEIPVPTQEEAMDDLENLKSSARWTELLAEWQKNRKTSPQKENWIWEGIEEQANRVGG